MEAEGHKVHSWRVGDTRFTNTKIFNVTRRAEMTFVRVPCDGSKRIDDSLMESIEPFDYTGIKPFSMSYPPPAAELKSTTSPSRRPRRSSTSAFRTLRPISSARI